MTISHLSDHNDTRDSLLNELESIRSLLNEHNEATAPDLKQSGSDAIPVLHDTIPTLNTIPVLNTVVQLAHEPDIARNTHEIIAQDVKEPTPAIQQKVTDQLDAVRAAAAMVAAKAIRNRQSEVAPSVPKQVLSTVTAPTTVTPPTARTEASLQTAPRQMSAQDHDKLITDILDELRPRLEELLRTILTEKLTVSAHDEKRTR